MLQHYMRYISSIWKVGGWTGCIGWIVAKNWTACGIAAGTGFGRTESTGVRITDWAGTTGRTGTRDWVGTKVRAGTRDWTGTTDWADTTGWTGTTDLLQGQWFLY